MAVRVEAQAPPAGTKLHGALCSLSGRRCEGTTQVRGRGRQGAGTHLSPARRDWRLARRFLRAGRLIQVGSLAIQAAISSSACCSRAISASIAAWSCKRWRRPSLRRGGGPAQQRGGGSWCPAGAGATLLVGPLLRPLLSAPAWLAIWQLLSTHQGRGRTPDQGMGASKDLRLCRAALIAAAAACAYRFPQYQATLRRKFAHARRQPRGMAGQAPTLAHPRLTRAPPLTRPPASPAVYPRWAHVLPAQPLPGAAGSTRACAWWPWGAVVQPSAEQAGRLIGNAAHSQSGRPGSRIREGEAGQLLEGEQREGEQGEGGDGARGLTKGQPPWGGSSIAG